ncbi:hypothetical protein WG66_002019 [Moniliophthora roreri]|nr:hypothetical protein WG66_002019 [Moniliophthora roreri]
MFQEIIRELNSTVVVGLNTRCIPSAKNGASPNSLKEAVKFERPLRRDPRNPINPRRWSGPFDALVSLRTIYGCFNDSGTITVLITLLHFYISTSPLSTTISCLR